MSRNLRKKKSTWLVIDETGSEGDDDFPTENDCSDYEIETRSNKIETVKKDKRKVSVTKSGEIKRVTNTNRKVKTTGSKGTVRGTKKVATTSSIKESGIDKSNTRSSAPKSKSRKLYEDKDNDNKPEHQPHGVTATTDEIICVIDSDESDSKTNFEDVRNKSRATERKEKKKVLTKKDEKSSETDVTLSSAHEIIIEEDDDEDIKLDTIIPVGNTKRKASDERVAPKRIKAAGVSLSKSKLNAVKKTKELADTGEKFLSTNEIIIDDEDDEDINPPLNIPVKTTRKRKVTETSVSKKAKNIQDSQLEEKLGNDKNDEDLHTVELDIDKLNRDGKSKSDLKVDVEWSEAEYLTEFNQIEKHIAENLVSLFKNDNTIPFIARYRKEMTGGMEPEQLRSIKNTYDNIKVIKQRGLLILKTIDKLGKWSPEIHSAVTAAKTLNELELIYAPYKPGTKGSLAERARDLGLTSISEDILRGRAVSHLSALIDASREGLRNENEIRQGIMHIIADILSKDSTTFEGIRELRKTCVINIESTKSKAASSTKKDVKEKSNNVDLQKYENYFNFIASERMIKDYQILAINRGESQKILSVKVIIPDWFQFRLRDHCLKKYNFIRKVSHFHFGILEESFGDAYNRLIKPLISRQVRHDLNERAESASIEVFARNLKKLLLTPPLRGKTILGIDPGFSHGCKLAVISHCGNVLDTATIYPHTSSKSISEQHAYVIANLLKKHNCTIIALGNATACRETETFLTELIRTGVFAPLDISYTIVNEAGASIYSCSSEAKSEFPNMDPNIISAVSIARRLQDPLAELVKVEPKHLGIGMYQHDLPKKQLQLTLDEVISETVSFVGVDINTASHCLLKKVAGLNSLRATNIIELRNKRGFIFNRKQLLDVKGIGKKSFEQCAGFIRILPETILAGNKILLKEHPIEYLDQTWIHPESYDAAKKFLNVCNCDVTQLGTENVIKKVMSFANGNCELLAKQCGTSKTSMEIIIKGLLMKKGEDIRVKEDAPLFQRNLRCIDDLSANTRVTGSVRNVTNFGAFVDIGVGRAGLIHLGNMKGQVLSLGQRVEVIVLAVDKDRGRISLSL